MYGTLMSIVGGRASVVGSDDSSGARRPSDHATVAIRNPTIRGGIARVEDRLSPSHAKTRLLVSAWTSQLPRMATSSPTRIW